MNQTKKQVYLEIQQNHNRKQTHKKKNPKSNLQLKTQKLQKNQIQKEKKIEQTWWRNGSSCN
jgi:hypothetical protein